MEEKQELAVEIPAEIIEITEADIQSETMDVSGIEMEE